MKGPRSTQMMCGTVYAKSMPGLAADCTVMSVVSSTSWLCWTGLILHWSCLFESSLLDSGITLSHRAVLLSHLRCTKYTGYTELRLKPYRTSMNALCFSFGHLPFRISIFVSISNPTCPDISIYHLILR